MTAPAGTADASAFLAALGGGVKFDRTRFAKEHSLFAAKPVRAEDIRQFHAAVAAHRAAA